MRNQKIKDGVFTALLCLFTVGPVSLAMLYVLYPFIKATLQP